MGGGGRKLGGGEAERRHSSGETVCSEQLRCYDRFSKLFDGLTRNGRFDIVPRQRVILLPWINRSRIDAKALDLTSIKKSCLGLYAAIDIPADFYYSAFW